MYANKEANGIDWGKQLENIKSPFTGLGTDKQGNTNFNYLGAALLGGGTGLVTWALGRLLGLKSGPSLTAGLLGALATSYYAFGKQKYGAGWNPFSAEQGKGLFANAGNQIKNTIEQKRAARHINNANTLAEKSSQQRVDNGTFKNVNPYVPNAPVTTATKEETELPPIIDVATGRNIQGIKRTEAARQRRAQIEAQPQAASPSSTRSQNNIAARKQEHQRTKDLLNKYHINGTNIALSLGLRTYGMPSAPNAPQIGGGSLTVTR